jgi:flavin reductase (DIM6/NTAB) family NADH-FMN oxidoreductase RutF
VTGDGSDRDGDDFDRLRRRVLWALPTGLFVVGSRDGDTRNLMTCNWVMQIATSPKLVAVAVESGSVTRRLVERGRSFSVSLLARSERDLVRRFVKPVTDVELDDHGVATSLQGEPVVEVAGGLPCLAVSVAWLACSVRPPGTIWYPVERIARWPATSSWSARWWTPGRVAGWPHRVRTTSSSR